MTLPLLLLLGLCLPPLASAQDTSNLLGNPSFETMDPAGASRPAEWGLPDVAAGAGAVCLASPGHSGSVALRLDGPATGAMPARVTQGPFPVRAEATYQFTCWVRAGAAYRVLLREDRGPGLPALSAEIIRGAATPDWTLCRAPWHSSDAARSATLTLVADVGGSVWFDDVVLRHIADRPRLCAPFVPPPAAGHPDAAALPWSSAAAASTPFLALDGEGAPAPALTSVRLMHDGDSLHLALDCDEPAPASLVRCATSNGPQVWSDDCVELLIVPGDPAEGIIHLGISAGGGHWQERIGGRQWYSDWYSWAAGPAAIPPWDSAVSLTPDGWRAIASVPLATLGGPQAIGRSFGLQLCRTRRAAGAAQCSTWAYTPGARFARPEAFGTLTLAPLTAPAPPGPLHARPPTGAPWLLPAPREVQVTPGRLTLLPSSTIRIAAQDQTDAAAWLQQDLRGRFGLAVPASLEPAPPGATADVSLGLDPEPGMPLSPEGFSLSIDSTGARLRAADPRGRQWGVAVLRQLLSASDSGPTLPLVRLTDAPALRFRGWHLTSPLQDELPQYHRLLDAMALLRLNTLVLQVDDRMQYASRPEISRPGAATADQLRELVDYARRRQIEVIPQLSTFSHFNYVLRVSRYASLAESPKTTLGTRDKWNYCPLNPDTYPLVFGLMQEVVQAFTPTTFHIGHDEVADDDLAVCPRCRGRVAADLWAQDVATLASWLRDRGIRPAMWADSLLADRTGGKPHQTYLALDRIPRDVLLLDWRYEPAAPFAQDLATLRGAGFEAVGCPWYEPENIARCATEALASGALGTCGTTWLGLTQALERSPHIPSALALAAQVFWSPEALGSPSLTAAPGPAFERIWSIAGGEPAPVDALPTDLTPLCNTGLADDDDRRGWMGEGSDYDLRNLQPGLLNVGGIPFDLPAGPGQPTGRCLMLAGTASDTRRLPWRALSIPVGIPARALCFLHCTGLPDRRDRRLYSEGNPGAVGYYVVHYEDGATEVVPLTYQSNIDDWNSQRGPALAQGLLSSRTRAGALVSIAAVRWPNPRPDATIASLDLVSLLAGPRLALLGLSVEVGGERAASVP